MQQLSLVKRSPFEFNDLDLCLRYNPQAIIVLMQDAVIAACSDNLWLKQLQQKQVYLIKSDLEARGLQALTGQTIDYLDLVTLTEQNSQIQSW